MILSNKTDFVLSGFEVTQTLFLRSKEEQLLTSVFVLSRLRLWKISVTYLRSRGGSGCSTGSMNSTKSFRRRWTRGNDSSHTVIQHCIVQMLSLVAVPARKWADHLCTLFLWFCVSFRDALNKMKDVYEKNPQMGDPSSLQPKISETICNMEKLRSEIHKNEVKRRQRSDFKFLLCVSWWVLSRFDYIQCFDLSWW